MNITPRVKYPRCHSGVPAIATSSSMSVSKSPPKCCPPTAPKKPPSVPPPTNSKNDINYCTPHKQRRRPCTRPTSSPIASHYPSNTRHPERSTPTQPPPPLATPPRSALWAKCAPARSLRGGREDRAQEGLAGGARRRCGT